LMEHILSVFLLARRLASAFEIFSPAYSAIFRRPRKGLVAKQPLPLISDFLIVNPGDNFSFIRLPLFITKN
jgi:hypothetical protein